MSGNARTAQLERKASNWRGSQGRDPSEMQPAAWRTCQPGPSAERLQRLPGLVQLEESYLGLYYAKSSKWITKQHVWPVTHFYCLYPMQWPCNPLVFRRGGRGGKGKEERAREKETIWNGQFPLEAKTATKTAAKAAAISTWVSPRFHMQVFQGIAAASP